MHSRVILFVTTFDCRMRLFEKKISCYKNGRGGSTDDVIELCKKGLHLEAQTKSFFT
jgi:hypothetical protein